MRGMSSTCRPWQVDGRFSALVCLSSSTCRPWQVHGRFSAPTKSGHKPADLGRLMATLFENQSSGHTPADLGRFMATFAINRYVKLQKLYLWNSWPRFFSSLQYKTGVFQQWFKEVIIQGDSCTRDFCPSRQFSKHTIVQGFFCPEKFYQWKACSNWFFLFAINKRESHYRSERNQVFTRSGKLQITSNR